MHQQAHCTVYVYTLFRKNAAQYTIHRHTKLKHYTNTHDNTK